MANASQDYLLWPNALQDPYSAVLGSVDGLDGAALIKIWNGQPWSGEFPVVQFPFSPDFPDNTVLSDNLMNKYQLIVVSERLKEFLAGRKLGLVEYQPVIVRDHKGKKTEPYYLVNPLNPIDCLDRQASGAIVRPTEKTQIMHVKRLVLRKDAIDPNRQLFRIANYTQARMVRRDLVAAIEKMFVGLKFRELDAAK
jgi:hypothetical protein